MRIANTGFMAFREVFWHDDQPFLSRAAGKLGVSDSHHTKLQPHSANETNVSTQALA